MLTVVSLTAPSRPAIHKQRPPQEGRPASIIGSSAVGALVRMLSELKLGLTEMATWPHIFRTGTSFALFGIYLLFLSITDTVEATSPIVTQTFAQAHRPVLENIQQSLRSILDTLASSTRQRYLRTVSGQFGLWDMVQLVAVCSLFQAWRIWKRGPAENHQEPNISTSSQRINWKGHHNNVRLPATVYGSGMTGESSIP